jgi:RNA polymerase sigma-70 factor (ECF subfamily)
MAEASAPSIESHIPSTSMVDLPRNAVRQPSNTAQDFLVRLVCILPAQRVHAQMSESVPPGRVPEVTITGAPQHGMAGGGSLGFETFFETEVVRLYRALCLVTRDPYEAEELTQEAFVRVLERWDRVSIMENPSGYLYRTAMNAFRKTRRRAQVATRRALGIEPSADSIATIDGDDVAMRALATLTERQRAAVVLTDLLGYPSAEAGAILGMRPGTVRTHVARAHAALKESMGS